MRLRSLELSREQQEKIERWRERRLASRDAASARVVSGLVQLAALGMGLGVKGMASMALAFDLMNTLAGAFAEVFDSTLGWGLSILAAPLELVFSFPYLGRGLAWVWRIALSLIWLPLHLPELLFSPTGVLPEKRLRLWVQLPCGGLSEEAQRRLDEAIAVAGKIYRREANVRLVPVSVFQMNYPAAVEAVERPSPWQHGTGGWQSGRLDVGCGREALREDLGPLGGKLERMGLRNHFRGAYRRLLGWGAPIMVLIVNTVDAGRLAGCSLGPLTDYVTVRGDQPVCLAHEIGHACNLLHLEDPMNLMNLTCGGVHLRWWQVMLLRLSRHVTYL
jgi:hypothetical protein